MIPHLKGSVSVFSCIIHDFTFAFFCCCCTNYLMNDAVLKHIMGELLNLHFMEVSYCTWVSKLARDGKKLLNTTINLGNKFLILCNYFIPKLLNRDSFAITRRRLEDIFVLSLTITEILRHKPTLVCFLSRFHC